ncbi:MAG TPA: hypothetical protein VML54_10495, partial [Candidatus Limnocylindrales bacterium]|nr:hypothetical protein [Candidatus Limnocylindrales bacterium]
AEMRLRIRTASGLEVEVATADIVARRRDGERARRTDPNYSRLMFAPTGRPLKKGDGYFSSYEVFLPGVSYGLTDHFTLSGGVSTIPGLGLTEQLFYVSPKVGFEMGERQAYSAGFLYATAGGDHDRESVGLAYGVATFGTPRSSVSLGFGLAGGLGDNEGLRTPIIMAGGQKTVGANVALVGESWIVFHDDEGTTPFVGLGVRFFGERLSADVGAILFREVLEEGFPIPWISVSYHFGPSRPRVAAAPSRHPMALAVRR